MEPVGLDNGDGTYMISDVKDLYELSWDELRELNDRFKLESDVSKRSIKEFWMRQAVFIKSYTERDAFPDDNHEYFTKCFFSGLDQAVYKTLGFDTDLLFYCEKYGERYDNLTWEQYLKSIQTDNYSYEF